MAEAHGPKHLRIEAIQTVTPAKATDQGKYRKVTTTGALTGELLRSHHQIVAYYKTSPTGKEESGDNLVGWFKESLNVALVDHPLFAGRLRRNEEEGRVEIKLNDSGLRLLQAKAEVPMEEFMEMKGKEGVLAYCYWVDVDETKPEFSALCYIQVTFFEGEGYSIGLSCSVLLADQVMLTTFFKKWAQIHSTMAKRKKLSNLPLFNLGKFRISGQPKFDINSTPATKNHQTLLFKFHNRESIDHENAFEEVLKFTGRGRGSVMEYRLVVSEGEDVRIETCTWKENEGSGECGLKVVGWDVLNAEEAAVGEWNLVPVRVSHHVISNEGLVVSMVQVPTDGSCLITATVPAKK